MPRTTKSSDGAIGPPRPATKPRKANGSAHAGDDERVARLAYELFEGRGGQHGSDLDDWLEAERRLKPGQASVTGPKPRKRKTSIDAL